MENSTKSPGSSSRSLSNIIYKAIYAAAFLAVLPLFPSQAPNFMNHAIFTRGWEPLRLLVVGFAISYGIFSRRSAAETEEPSSPTSADDTAESFISRFLQVSPVFDDEDPESPDGSSPDVEKMQTWSSRYHRNEPVVMVAGEKTNGASANGGTRPLLLPVRSLKSCIQDTSSFISDDEIESSLKTDRVNRVDASPSTIPWRTRSGKMEVKEEHSSGPSRSSSFRTSSTKKLSTSLHSVSPELRAKSSNDLERKTKSYHVSSAIPPPPPPPPPPPFRHGRQPVPDHDEKRKPFKDELKDASDRGRNRAEASLENSRSVRTVRQKEAHQLPSEPKIIVSSDDSCSDCEGPASSTESSEEEDYYRNEAEEEGAQGENEVDKKANEFIAKFREQIRLQRAESIRKRSTGQRRIKDLKQAS